MLSMQLASTVGDALASTDAPTALAITVLRDGETAGAEGTHAVVTITTGAGRCAGIPPLRLERRPVAMGDATAGAAAGAADR